jgi:predicted aspartyl protease
MECAAKYAALMTFAAAVCFGASAASAPPQYRIKLGPYLVPPTRTAGLIVKARVNGGPPLRLLLDSGTQYVVLDRKAAAKSGCAGGTDLDLIGAGAPAASVVKTQLAETLQLGDLTLRDVPMLVTNHALADGIQGVLPLSIFSGFLIRLDVPGNNLDLLPYPSEEMAEEGALRSVLNNQLLFVRGRANDSRDGYFLLDTGASYTAISRKLARQLSLPESIADRVPLQAGTTELDAPILRGAVRLRFGSHELATDPVVAVDLSASSRYHSLEISGLIGYPALCRSVVTVSYRDNLIRIDPR